MNEAEQSFQWVRVTVVLDELTKKVDNLNDKLEHVKDGFILQATSETAVLKDKVSRLETIIYGSIMAMIGQIIAIIILFLKH